MKSHDPCVLYSSVGTVESAFRYVVVIAVFTCVISGIILKTKTLLSITIPEVPLLRRRSKPDVEVGATSDGNYTYLDLSAGREIVHVRDHGGTRSIMKQLAYKRRNMPITQDRRFGLRKPQEVDVQLTSQYFTVGLC